jgi:hypothetical protein
MKKIIIYIISLSFFSSLNAQGFEHITFTVDVSIVAPSMKVNGQIDTTANCSVPLPLAGSNYIIRKGIIYGEPIETPDSTLWSPCDNPENISVTLPLGGLSFDTISGEYNSSDTIVVIGDWDCRGWFIQDVASAYEGVFDLSTQTFHFDSIPEINIYEPCSITTDGGVLRQFFEEGKRAVVGGTGALNYVLGDVSQGLIGKNESGLWNIRATFNLYYLPAD